MSDKIDGIFSSKPNASRSRKSKSKVKREETNATALAETSSVTSVSPAVQLEPPTRTQSPIDAEEEEALDVKTEERSLSLGTNDASSLSPMATVTPISSGRAVLGFSSRASNDKRIELLNTTTSTRQMAVQRFYALLLPTLVDVYAASIDASIRNKTMQGMTKIIYFCQKDHLATILNALPLATFLGAILLTKDQPSLVTNALQLVELLLVKVPETSPYLFWKEGVMHEVDQLANAELSAPILPKENVARGAPETDGETAQDPIAAGDLSTRPLDGTAGPSGIARALMAGAHTLSTGAVSTRHRVNDVITEAENQMKDLVTLRARFMRDRYCSSGSSSQAKSDLESIKTLASQLEVSADSSPATNLNLSSCLTSIAKLFATNDQLISSFELLESGLVDALLKFALSCKGSTGMLLIFICLT